MTIVSRIWKVDSQRPLNPAPIIETAMSEGWPRQWIGLVNSVSCPRGRKYGEAHFLLSAATLGAITTSDAVDIEIEHENGISTFTGYYVTRTQSISGGTDDSAHWITLADRRWLLERSALNVRYNLRNSPDGYVEDTTDSGTPYTWAQIVADIWGELPAAIAGSAPSLPITPSSTPENLVLEGMSAWEGLNLVLTAIGCVVCLDPFVGTFSIQDAKATQSGLEAIKTANEDRILWKYSPQELPATNYPEEVAVTFPRLPGDGDSHSPFPGPPEVEEVSLGGGGLAGTKWPVIDTLMAYDDNSSERTTRAAEIKDAILGLLKPMAEPWGAVYSGCVEFKPGSELTEVTWSSDGERGTRTIAKFSAVAIEWPDLILQAGDGGFTRIEIIVESAEIVSNPSSPFDGMLKLTGNVKSPSCNNIGLWGTSADIYEHEPLCLLGTEAPEDLIGRKAWGYEGVHQDMSSGAGVGDLTPCHMVLDGICCPEE